MYPAGRGGEGGSRQPRNALQSQGCVRLLSAGADSLCSELQQRETCIQ